MFAERTDIFMDEKFRKIIKDREEITVRYDVESASVWCYFNPKIRPCYSYTMLQEIHTLQLEIIDYFHYYDMHPPIPIRFFVLASQTRGIYNYGGDLNLFERLIREKDRETLFKYGQLGTEIIYLNSVDFHLPLTTVAVVEGTALGGGFEAVLSCSVSIVEEQCKMGLPEIRFNLFPGMGAYSLLARLVGVKKAEEIMTSGKVYQSRELCELGLLTQLTKEGKARERAVYFMKKYNRLQNGMQAVASARHRYLQLKREEFMDINRIWVETALKLTPKDLKVMHKLVEAQNQKYGYILKKNRARQDRRISYLLDSSTTVNNAFPDRRKGRERRVS